MIYSKWTVGPLPAQAKAIREAVFIREQGFAPEEKFDEQDQQAWHLVVEMDEQPVATGRLAIDREGNWKLGSIAVLPDFRGQKIGDFVVRLLVDRALSMPKAPIYVIAQQGAVGFYQSIGFRSEGPVFEHHGRPHQRMVFPEGAQLAGCCGGQAPQE